jgi:hypothetical protein
MSRLLDFYRGDAADAEGRFLKEILAWHDGEWEMVHDFIQWLFPLPEPSRFNADAPLLTAEDIAAFHAEKQLRAGLRESYDRFLEFVGLALAGDKVVEGEEFASRVPDIWASWNHNWLRISRVLRTLKLLGLETEAQAFCDWLESVYKSRRFPITPETFSYWSDAVASHL